jgi:hypothetical protein
MIIDAWAQHPTARHLQDPIFDSLRRWTKGVLAPQTELPVAATIAAMDQAGVGKSLISAWYAPRNVMISNDEVASFVAQAPDRLVGVGSVDISKPMQAVGEIRRCVEQLRFKAIRVLPWLWGNAADRSAILSGLCGVLRDGRAVLHADRPHRPADAVGGRTADLSGSGRAGFSRAGHRRRPYRFRGPTRRSPSRPSTRTSTSTPRLTR